MPRLKNIITRPKLSNPPTAEEVEPYLLHAAHLVDKYGSVMQPWLDRMEKIYSKARARGGNVDRIEKMLAEHHSASPVQPEPGDR